MPWPLGRPKPPTRAKLTPAQVLEIRRRYRDGGETQRQIAADYGVSCDCISEIVNNFSWRHLPGTWDPELDNYLSRKMEA